MRDIKPYVCLLPDCKTPYTTYSSGRSWLEHMSTESLQWHCLCFGPQGPPAVFFTNTEFIHHVRGEHSGQRLSDLDLSSSQSVSLLPERIP